MRRTVQVNLFDQQDVPHLEGTGLDLIASERDLVAIAMALGARGVSGWSEAEQALAGDLPEAPGETVRVYRERILGGEDPLGECFCRLRSPAERRERGATFTPSRIVRAMLDSVGGKSAPTRIVDAGMGSGRFLVEAGKRFDRGALVGVESDPVPAILARANLATLGLGSRATILVGDYRETPLGPGDGLTLFLGNPPYVRHHLLGARWKSWLVAESRRRGLRASQLAGLHVHFFLATLAKARAGDLGVFITASEWLDVNYGSLVRDLLLGGLGGRRIVVIEPTALPFTDAATTAAITSFEVGSRPATVSLARVATLDEMSGKIEFREVPRERLESERRWSRLTRPARKGPEGYVELGDLCRVHRGAVTGANKVWIAGDHAAELPPSVLYPAVTKARELFRAGKVLEDPSMLRQVVDLPLDLDRFDPVERMRIERFLKEARAKGADRGYIARNRRAWWSVGLRAPAPILATYMARRPPAFVRNRAGVRHINIAHGLYPREPIDDQALMNLIAFLSGGISTDDGRTYAGGLTKFEPREMERLRVPGRKLLSQKEGAGLTTL